MDIKSTIELLKRFNDQIDELIIYSSTDFVSISKHLRNYYSQSTKITENAIEISRLLNCRESKDFFRVLDGEYEEMKIKLIDFQRQVSLFGDLFERLQTNFTLINISFNNFTNSTNSIPLFREDVYKLFEDIKNPEEKQEIIKNIDEFKATMNFVNSFVVCNFAQIRSSLTDSLKVFTKLKKTKIETSESTIQKTSKILGLFAKNHKLAVVRLPLIVEKSSSCAMSIDKIITDIQYHDIIRQKLEHIQQINKKLVEEFEVYAESSDSKNFKYLGSFYDIMELHHALLYDANNYCQCAFSDISSNLSIIENNNHYIDESSKDFINHIHFYEYAEILDIKNKLAQTATLLFNKVKFDDLLNENIHSTSDLLKDIEWYVEEFSTIANEAIEINKFYNENKFSITPIFVKEFTAKFISLNQRFTEISSKVHELTLLLIEWAKKLDILIATELETNNTEDSIEAMIIEKVKSAILPLNEKNRIFNILSKNNDLIAMNAETISQSINHINHSEYFENIIASLVDNSKRIIEDDQKIKLPKQDFDRNIGLEEIELSYTMQSERTIHNRVIDHKGKTEQCVPCGQVESDSIELF